MKNKKGAIPQVALVISIIAGLLAVNFNVASIVGSGDYIERPVFKYVKCEAIGGFKWSSPTILASNGQWLPRPSSTTNYQITASGDATTLMQNRFEYYICNNATITLQQSNCRVFSQKVSGTSVDINGIKGDEYVWMQYQKAGITTGFSWREEDGAKYQIGFIPFGLREYDVLSGSAAPINPNNCEVSVSADSWKDRLLYTDADKVNAKISANVNERILQPNEVRWYVSGYVTSAAPSFALNYNGKEAWCRTTGTTAEIYQINTVKLGSGTYKVASPDWSDKLGNEICCPNDVRGDEVCNDNFDWEKVGGSECGAFKSCGSPNWIPYSENTLIKYSCVNGYCQSETKQVECANDYDCRDSNQLCDLNSWTCVNPDVNIDGQVIETIPDNLAECQAAGGEWVTETTEQKSFLNFLGIGEPKIIVTEYCDMDKPNYIQWILVFGIIFLVLFLFRGQLFALFNIVGREIGL
jgi:hypothetical protein